MAAGNHLAYKFFNYSDSDQTGIWENLFLYTTDLTDKSSLSLRYGLDAVSSPSFGVVSTTSGASSKEHDENNLKFRNSAGISFSNQYTETLKGSTGLDVSLKPDYNSITLGQSLDSPILGDFFNLGVGGYYTHSRISPAVTTNVNLQPPAGELSNRQVNYLLSLEHILTTKSKIKFLFETFQANGYLSTGYHRVTIVSGAGSPESLENLPDNKSGTALTAIYSQGLSDKSALHLRVRGYKDSYSINAFSGDAKYRTYLDEQMILEFSYRYYKQTSASFWGSSFVTKPTGYFTSQAALGEFNAQQFGLGVRYEITPFYYLNLNLSGILSANLERYLRSDGFTYSTFSTGFETDF